MVSVVIPTQNMSLYLRPLLESFISSGCSTFISEYIVVNDGSHDDTTTIIESLKSENLWHDKLHLITNTVEQGRFVARKQGALAAKEDLIFFADTRVLLAEDAGQKLKELLKTHKYLMGMPIINTKKSIFNLYWERSHQWIYRKHYQAVKNGFYLTYDNYESYAKGTGMVILERSEFLRCCEVIGTNEMLADDTVLLREVVKKHPLFVTENFAYLWEPRQRLSDFLLRLIDRGPGFVQYNFFTKRNKFFFSSILAFLYACFALSLSTIFFGSFFLGLVILITTGASSIFLFTKNPAEVAKLLPLHILVLTAFSIGIFYGLLYYFANGHKGDPS